MAQHIQPSKHPGWLKASFYIAWILSVQISFLVAVAIILALQALQLMENGEFGFVQAFGIWILVLFTLPLIFLAGWGYFGRQDPPRKVLTAGVVGMCLQVVVLAGCAMVYDFFSGRPLASASLFFSPELIGIWIAQVFLVGVVIALQVWHREIRRIAVLLIVGGMFLVLVMGGLSVISSELALVSAVRCNLTVVLLSGWFKGVTCK